MHFQQRCSLWDSKDHLNFTKKKTYDFEAVLISKNGEIYVTDGIKDRFTLTSNDYILKTGDEK